MKHVKILVSGKVQGVGFRFLTYDKFVELGLTGQAKNLPDGTVQITTSGEAPAVEALLEWCKQGPSGSQVKDVLVEVLEEAVEPGPAA